MSRALPVRWFTLREILMIVVVISVGLLSVVFALSRGMNYVQYTRQKMLALDLAREGIEAVYNIRDTNRMRWAGVKDACRLKIDPLVDEATPWCCDDTWFESGYYLLQSVSLSGQSYFALTGIHLSWDVWEDVYGYLSSPSSLCVSSGTWQSCTQPDVNSSQWKFFRLITGRWLYFKDDLSFTWWRYMACSWWLLSACANSRAKEFRFCSDVWYGGLTTWHVQICSLITNFQE